MHAVERREADSRSRPALSRRRQTLDAFEEAIGIAMFQLGSLLAVEPKTSNVSLSRGPMVVRRSSHHLKSLPSGRKRNAANWNFLPLISPLNPGIRARFGVVVEGREDSRGPRACRLAPAGAEDLPLVGLVVAVGIFQKRMCGGCATITPPLAKTRLVGMLRWSANSVNLSARPSPLVSSRMRIRSSPGLPFSASFG